MTRPVGIESPVHCSVDSGRGLETVPHNVNVGSQPSRDVCAFWFEMQNVMWSSSKYLVSFIALRVCYLHVDASLAPRRSREINQ